MSICQEIDCERNTIARGWCQKHYMRWWLKVKDDPTVIKNPKGQTLEQVLWKWVTKTDTCWLWTGNKGKTGYGRLIAGGKNYAAHRAAYLLLVGPIPEGLELDHLCRVRNCVNPDHLEPVTHQENLSRGVQRRKLRALEP